LIARSSARSDDVWLGTWYQNARYKPPFTVLTAADGIADAWQPFLMLRNPDDYGQKLVTPSDVGGGDTDYFNGLNVNRRVGSDRKLGEEGAADGVIRTNPHGYDAVYVDYQVKNPNGQCTATMRYRGDGGLRLAIDLRRFDRARGAHERIAGMV
jgi:hypothetical protein